MPQVTVNGASLDYSERGRGQALALVHGSASDQRTWQGQQELFAERFRAIAYSRRYHWPNRRIAAGADYSMLEHVDDLAALLQARAAAPAHLVGHSYGGFVCLLLAIRRPHLVRSLVLTEPPVLTLFASYIPRPTEILKLLCTRPRTGLAIVTFGARAMAPAQKAAQRGDLAKAMEVFGRRVVGAENYARMSRERLEQVHANAIEAELLGSGFPPLAPDDVRRVRVPTLLITGSRSPALFHRLCDGLAELLPRSESVRIERASHVVHEDNAAAFNGAVLSFLEGVSRSADGEGAPPRASPGRRPPVRASTNPP